MLTRGQIISTALTRAGREDLTSDARRWLNTFLETMYTDQDFNWLLKRLYNQAITQDMSFPADYRALKVARIKGSNLDLEEVSVDELFSFSTDVSGGAPTKIYADRGLRQFHFWPAPGAGYYMDLAYYYMPTLPDATDPATDSQTPVWGLSVEVLVQAIYVKALEYNDDVRQDKEMDKLRGMIAESKMNSFDMRAGKNRIPLGKSFRKRF